MKLSVLCDNTASGTCLAEHGLSYYIEHDGLRVLFDTGQTDVFLRNARTMGIDLRQGETVVLSHGHFDHGGGLGSVPEGATLVSHPDVFIQRFRKTGNPEPIGLAFSRGRAEERWHYVPSAEPYRLSETVVFLGSVPRATSFEAQRTPFRDADGNDDFVPDDSALAVSLPDGLVVVSGCAHAGICNTVAHARDVTGQKRMKAVIGGFHLKHDDDVTARTIAFLKDAGVERVLPSHCTELPALAAFYRAFGMEQVRAGMVFEF